MLPFPRPAEFLRGRLLAPKPVGVHTYIPVVGGERGCLWGCHHSAVYGESEGGVLTTDHQLVRGILRKEEREEGGREEREEGGRRGRREGRRRGKKKREEGE